MIDKNGGGCAFPRLLFTYQNRETGEQMHTGTFGMSLRDYFAAKAMETILARVVEVDGSLTTRAVESATEGAYFMADAMLKARG